jgi:putative glycosyltransferase (TIGR04372 family)
MKSNIIQNFKDFFDNLRHIFFKLRLDLRRTLASLFFSLGMTVYNQKLSGFSFENLRRLPDLNLWSNKNNKKFFQIVKCDNYAAKLWLEGHCKKSIQLQKENHIDYYNYLNLDISTHFPNCMSANWTYKIGHFYFLGIFSAAQKMGIVPSKKRVLFQEPGVSNLNILDSASSHFQIVRSPLGIDWSNLPALWHLYERLNMIKTENSFIHIYELIEQVMDLRLKSEEAQRPFFQLDENYVIESIQILNNLGLRNNKKFIGLHVRNIGGKYFLRNQSIDTYLPAIKFIISEGFQVIRIGNPSDDVIPPLDGFIDLTKNLSLSNKLDAYILANCEFFIGTNSGPASIPQIFGIPTLYTNMTSLGKNILTSIPGSRYIPKTFTNSKNIKLSLSQILSNPVTGYSELNSHNMKKFGFGYQNNSADDILSGVIEMFDFVYNSNLSSKKSKFLNALNQINEEFEPIGRGIYSEAYLEKNEDWFLKFN